MSAPRFSRRAEWAVGQPISDLMSRALANPDLISLAAGFVDQQTLPVEPIREAVRAILADPAEARAALQYGTTTGYPPLREQLLADFLAGEAGRSLGPPPGVEQVVVTAGSNQLLHLVCESILDPGDIVLCAAPTYLVFLGTLAGMGARAVGVAADEGGMIPEALEERLRAIEKGGELDRVKAIYVVSYYDNPAGATMPLARREAVVDAAGRWSKVGQIFVIEDAAYRELRYAGDDLPSLRVFDDSGERVVVAGTFSKSFSPGVRVGWGILPPSLVEPTCAQKGNIDFGSPNFSQHLMSKVLESGLYVRHIEAIRASYSRKLQCMLAAAQEFLGDQPGVSWQRPEGGLYVWLELPPKIDTGPGGRLFDLALEEGVLYVPGEYCYPQEGQPPQKNRARLSFGVKPPEQIRAGMASLSRALARAVA